MRSLQPARRTEGSAVRSQALSAALLIRLRTSRALLTLLRTAVMLTGGGPLGSRCVVGTLTLVRLLRLLRLGAVATAAAFATATAAFAGRALRAVLIRVTRTLLLRGPLARFFTHR